MARHLITDARVPGIAALLRIAALAAAVLMFLLVPNAVRPNTARADGEIEIIMATAVSDRNRVWFIWSDS